MRDEFLSRGMIDVLEYTCMLRRGVCHLIEKG